MKLIKKLCLEYKINRDNKFLVKRGIEKAKEKGLFLKIGDAMLIPHLKGDIGLPDTKRNFSDSMELIELVADDYPEITDRYLNNLEKLKKYQ